MRWCACCSSSSCTVRRASTPGTRIIANRAGVPGYPHRSLRDAMTPEPLLYLASRSPRRTELLRQLGIPFETLLLREASGRDRDVREGALDGEPPAHYVERMARTKAGVGWQRMFNRLLPAHPVLGADTEVVLGSS